MQLLSSPALYFVKMALMKPTRDLKLRTVKFHIFLTLTLTLTLLKWSKGVNTITGCGVTKPLRQSLLHQYYFYSLSALVITCRKKCFIKLGSRCIFDNSIEIWSLYYQSLFFFSWTHEQMESRTFQRLYRLTYNCSTNAKS